MPSNEILETALSETLGTTVSVFVSSPVGGGSINQTFSLETTHGQFFLKVNSATRFPKMFDAETKGLLLLKENSSFVVPKPIVCFEHGGQQFLIMEWVTAGAVQPDSYTDFGTKLARMHATPGSCFGLDHDNYIGSLPQSNTQHLSWPEFYWTERLLPQFKLAEIAGFGPTLKDGFHSLEMKMEFLFPSESPALLHGDLWSGNYSIAEDGPTIFDPAVYYGHREMDLAMMKLFGGFPEEVFSAYDETFPLEPDWETRIPLGQLYPLMVHVNLFGASYVAQVQQILSHI